MYIKNININNNSVKINNAELNFTNNGIYLIHGKNGTGKTTLLENIIFGKNNVEFNNPIEEKIYLKNRFQLFAYISQEVCNNNLLVYDYIIKGNPAINEEKLVELLDKFDMDFEILKKKTEVLSGGEKIKISIISNFLKDVPYIFLDEPTNNLDDSSVDRLLSIINDFSKNKKIIIVSHDSRLNALSFVRKYKLEDDKICCIENNKMENNENDVPFECCCLSNKINFFKIIILITKNLTFCISLFITILIIATLATFNHLYIRDNYSFDEIPKENVVISYANDKFDDLNKTYVTGEKLVVDEALFEKGITLNDVYDISMISDVKKIYLYDDYYLNEVNNKIIDGSIKEEITYLACPQIIYNDFYENTSFDYGVHLVQGNLPKDSSYEVAISKNMLVKHFGYNDIDVNEAIGDKIILDAYGHNEEFTIVGFSYYDYALISFEEIVNYGVYTYNERDFYEFGTNQIEYAQMSDSIVGKIWELIIITNDDCDGEVLNQMIQTYPAYNYYSNHYVKVWCKEYNKSIYTSILIPNVIVSLILALIIFSINRQSIAYNKRILKDFSNYYIKNKMISNIYKAISITLFMFIFLMIIIINSILSKFNFIGNSLLFFDFCIIMLSIIISLTCRTPKLRR